MLSKAKDVSQKYHSFSRAAHEEGALDNKTKLLLHIATVLALRCERWTESQLAVARRMGISEEELAETIQLVSSVSAGVLTSMALRAQQRSEPKQKNNLPEIFKV